MKIRLLTALLATASLCHAQTYTVESVPNTKLVNNSYVSNPDGILGESTVTYINSSLASLEATTTAQVAVVALNSIGEVDPVQFAQELFDRWKIGRAKKDNGLLILLVRDQRNIRFQTGLGLEGILPDITCKHIQMAYMVPYFQSLDYDGGMSAGVDEVVKYLSDPAYAAEIQDAQRKEEEGWPTFFWWMLLGGGVVILIWYLAVDMSGDFRDSKVRNKDMQYPAMAFTKLTWLFAFLVIPLAIVVLFNFVNVEHHIRFCLATLYGYAVLTLLFKRARMAPIIQKLTREKNYYGAVEFMQKYNVFWMVMAIIFALPMLFVYLLYILRKNSLRKHSRDCEECGKPMVKLDEQADDAFLEKGQIFEENLNSVDYDVWKCTGCNATHTYNYINSFSKFESCPKCQTRAFYLASDRTIRKATYSSSGSGEKVHRCKFCSHAKVETYSIAQLTSSSSSSSSGGGSSGSSGSSGGSWGGGSSGGGGASSSW